MDKRLLAWARAVKKRRNTRLPVLWLFTDSVRLADPLPSIRALPRGLCGVVFRHDEVPDRVALGCRLAKLCRARGLALVVAGDTRLAARLGAGVHLRGGRYPGMVRLSNRLITSSVHDMPQMLRAKRERAAIFFISPVFGTSSHPGKRPFGAARWARLARHAPGWHAYALGGITGRKINCLGQHCDGAGAIQAVAV